MSDQLLDTFQQDATSFLDQVRKTGNNVLLEDTKESVKVLFDIENIYKHSLSSGMFGQSHPWNYLKNFTNIVPTSSDLLGEIKASAKTNDGRLRLFIRLSLNEGNLTAYTRALVSIKPSIRKYYTDDSIMLHDHYSTRFVEQLAALEQEIQFRLFVKDGLEFDQANYWVQQFNNIQNAIGSITSIHIDEDILKVGQRRSVNPISPAEPEQIISEEQTIINESDVKDSTISTSYDDICNADNSPPIDELSQNIVLNEATSEIGSLNGSVTLPEELPTSTVDLSDLEDTMKMIDEIEKTVPATINQLGTALIKAAIEDDEDRIRRDEERLNILDEVFEQQKKEKEDKKKKFTEMNNTRRSSTKLRRSQMLVSPPSSTKTSVEVTTTAITSPRERVSTDADYSKSLKDVHAPRDLSHSQPNSTYNSLRRLSVSSLSASTGALEVAEDGVVDGQGRARATSDTSEEKKFIERRPVWIDDKDAVTCAKCEATFSLLVRRHHCRNCGKVFCAKCCKDKIPLPLLGYNKPVLVCADCLPDKG